jgi:hypothetical protein
MKKEIIECINKSIKAERERSMQRIKEQEERDKRREEQKRKLIGDIEKFFEGLSDSVKISLIEESDEEMLMMIGERQERTYKNPKLKILEADELIISPDHFPDPTIEKRTRFGCYGYYDDFNKYMTNWTLEQVFALYNNLDWVEKEIARKYGCGNAK